MVPKCQQFSFAGGVAFGIRRPHICWEITQDVPESHFIVDHLVLEMSVIKTGQILMRPGVRGDLVALSDHPLDNSSPLGSSINWTLSKIVSSDHECS